MSDVEFRISDFGCRKTEVECRMSDVGWLNFEVFKLFALRFSPIFKLNCRSDEHNDILIVKTAISFQENKQLTPYNLFLITYDIFLIHKNTTKKHSNLSASNLILSNFAT